MLPTLERWVVANGIKPRFLIDLTTIEFKRKTIAQPDKCLPVYQEIHFSNPLSRSVKWRIDTREIDSEKIFVIPTNQGIVEGG